jgi:6-pyruvoyl-tetrahydropterin synthase
VPKRPPLSETHPEIAAEAMFDPTTITAGSNKKMPWKCAAHGHKWEAIVSNRTDKKQGCPVCSGRKVLAGFNDLQTTFPDIAQEADFDPTTVVAGSHSKMPWKCAAHGHKWETTVDSRTGSHKTGCPVCSGRKVLAGFNDLQTTFPDIAQEADFDPTTVVAGSNKKMPWKCAAHGHRWEAKISHRARPEGSGCPICSNRTVLAGFNDLQTVYPEIAREADFDPTTVTAGTHKKMPWTCETYGHKWTSVVKDRIGKDATGCPVCSNRTVLAGFNDLQTTFPEIAREADFDPTTVVAGSNKKMPWKCAAHGHKWETTIDHRTFGEQGCPICTNNKVLSGFNDLQTTYPDIAQEADFDPTTVVAGTSKKKCRGGAPPTGTGGKPPALTEPVVTREGVLCALRRGLTLGTLPGST